MKIADFHKKISVIALVAGLGLAGLPALAQTMPTKIETIGLMVQDMSNPFFSAMDKGAKDAAAAIGATVNTQDAQLDLSAQHNQIDAFIQQGVDLIVVSAVDGQGISPAIAKAKEAGIIVIAVDTPAEGADAVIMTNAVQAGERSCEYLFEKMGHKGQVLLVDGTPIQTIIDRINGCKTVAAKYPDIQIVAEEYDNDDLERAVNLTASMIQAHPNLKGVFGANASAPIGAGRAIVEAGKKGEILLVGMDDLPEMVEFIRDGTALAMSVQAVPEIGYWSIMHAVALAGGQTTPVVHDTGSLVVDQSNLDSYK